MRHTIFPLSISSLKPLLSTVARLLVAAGVGMLALGVGSVPASAQVARARVVIIVVDGLRPDYITPELMPRLDRLAEGGVRGLRHHAAFPTVTRVNSPTIFSGRYPGTHGLLGNTVYLPAVAADRTLDASDREDLELIAARSGSVLTAPSLGQMLESQGKVFFAASSGSTGSGMLMNPTGAGAGIVHHAFALPASLERVVVETLGRMPADAAEGTGVPLIRRSVDAVLRIGVDRSDADVLAIWLTEPDGVAHDTGIGSPETVAVLAEVDREIGRLLDGLDQRGLLEATDILVTSDHGFSTRVGSESLEDLLVEAGLKQSEHSTDVVVAGDAIHVNVGGEERIREIVRLLQKTDWVGPVFTRARETGSELGWVPGTLAFGDIRWQHDRSADILTSANWTADVNEWGYPGKVQATGTAGHGTSSPWDIRATFVAAGPSFRHGVSTEVPTGNVDLAPTAMFLVGATVPADVDGRVLHELFTDGPALSDVVVESQPVSAYAVVDGISYRQTAERFRVGKTLYLHGTTVERSGIAPLAREAAVSRREAPRLTWVAHRGGIVPGLPENTLAAFRNAIASGIDAIEIDLRGTRDGVPVILHDATLDRTTDGSGPVGALALADLVRLDAGKGEPIPTYEEVLDLVSGTGTSLLLDIKISEELDLERVVALTREHHASRSVIAGVRTLDDLHRIQSLDPAIRTLGFAAEPNDVQSFIDRGVDFVRLWPEWMTDDPALFDRIAGQGVPIWVTAGPATATELAHLADRGVAGILADFPERINKARRAAGDSTN